MRGKARKLAAKGPCRVYWGTHGCRKQRGHVGRHFCEPGCPTPGETTLVFGEDVDLYPSPAGAPRGCGSNTGTMGHVPEMIELWQPSPLDSRFAPDAFADQIGESILITLKGPPPTTVTRILRAAVVDPGGTGVRLTLEAGDGGD